MDGPALLKDKDKKEKVHKIGWWQKKADDLCQEVGRNMYKYCEVCGKPMSCLHHYFPKSVSSTLRYDWDNLVPICQGCHNRHHQANDPRIHETVRQRRGGDVWYNNLLKKKYTEIRVNRAYYNQVLIDLNKKLVELE